ncbi:glycosyltransferase [Patescibacteria group bacterium]|nr:glycosyltransferase [Patescibacteria group bacterium]MBU1922380.1 glycosyltransferase [Patescibacteria group bacterium]
MLSIIIPTYNEQDFLPYLLKSIRAQDYKDYEIIVADANSEDRTRQVARDYGARVVDGGLPAAGRNRGAQAAKGEKFLFLDADVYLPGKDFLSKTIFEFDSRALDLATCYLEPISDKKVDILFHRFYNQYAKNLRFVTPHAPGFCIFVRRHVHEAIDGFNESIKLAEDHDYSKRARKFGQFGFLESAKIPVSVRRFDRDGRANIAIKYALCELHMFTIGGVKNDIFKYRFGYDTKEKTNYDNKRDI